MSMLNVAPELDQRPRSIKGRRPGLIITALWAALSLSLTAQALPGLSTDGLRAPAMDLNRSRNTERVREMTMDQAIDSAQRRLIFFVPAKVYQVYYKFLKFLDLFHLNFWVFLKNFLVQSNNKDLDNQFLDTWVFANLVPLSFLIY